MKNTTRPVTIKQILQATQAPGDDDFKIDGQDIGHLTIVGVVRNVVRTTTSVSIHIEDGTGGIDVRQWSDRADDDNPLLQDIQNDAYIRVICDLKSFNNKRNVHGHSIRRIQDPNEIFYHLLEALYVHLYFTKGPQLAHGTKPSDDNGITGTITDSVLDRTIAAQNLNPNQIKVMKVLHAENFPSEGLPGRKIAELAGIGDYVQADNIMQSLLNEGTVFTTIDDDHFASSLR